MNRGTAYKMALSKSLLFGFFMLVLSEQVSSNQCPPRSQFNACTCSELANDKLALHCNTISIENATRSILENDSLVQCLERLTFLGASEVELSRDSFIGLSNITVLRINFSPLVYIQPGAFNSLSRLQVLDLRHNNLVWLSADSFVGLSNSQLTELQLGSNHLANLRSDLQPFFTSINQILSLDDNSMLVCDCHLSWLRDFLLNYTAVTHSRTTCTSSSLSITDPSVDFNHDMCLDVCQLGYHPCDDNATCHIVSDDITSCQCNPGFIGDGITCTNICTPFNCSFCETTVCSQNATCEQQGTNALCTCNDGFTGDGYSCMLIRMMESLCTNVSCPANDDVYCIVTNGNTACVSEKVQELYIAFSEVEADPSRLPSFTEQLVNVSSNLTISEDIPQIITFLTESLNLLSRTDDYQEDTYNNLVMVGSELLDLDNHHLWFELQNVSQHVANLSLALYSLGREVLIKGNMSSSQNVTIASENIALVVVRPNCTEDNSNITVSSDILNQNNSEPQSSLQLPTSIFGEDYDCMEVAVIAVVYDNVGPLLSGEELIPPNNCTPTEAPLAHGQCEWYSSANCSTPQVNSVVISAFAVRHDNTSVNELDTSMLGDPIVITLHHKDSTTSMSSPTCVFVDDEDVRSGNGTWMTRQCEVVSEASSSNMTVCQCFHLTSFALLTSPTGPPPPNLPLQIVSKIGLCISILCLFVAIILLFCLKIDNKRLHHIHRQLALSLFLAQLVFLVFVDRTQVPLPDAACTLVAALLHYLFLCTFAWQLFEGIHLYIFIVKVFFNAEKIIWFYYPLAWGIPLIVVAITIGVNFCDYGSEHYCWITTGHGTNWAFHGPVIAVLVFNILVLVVVMYVVIRSARKRDSDTFLICTLFQSSAVLLPVLGITWSLGFFVVGDSIYSRVVEWLFCIFTTLQGIMILIMHCVLNRDVRKAFLKAIGCHEAARRQESTRLQLRRSSTVNSFQQFNARLKRRLSKTKPSTVSVDDITSYEIQEEFSSSFVVAKPAASSNSRPPSARTRPLGAVNPLHNIIEERESLPSSVAPSPQVNASNHGNVTIEVEGSQSSVETHQSANNTPQMAVRTVTHSTTHDT